jgi:amino acid adenylation domain-containing protein
VADSTSVQERLAGLSREERALLFERVRKRRESAAAPRERIPRRPPGLDPVPASFAQERLWFLDRLAPGSTAYNMALALRVEGPVAPATLESVLGEVVRRHEALRTTFRQKGGQPIQVIAPPGPWSLPVVDLAGLPATLRETAALRLAQEEAERPFDLERGPLLRAVLLRLAREEQGLLLTLHHIISDGWSLGVLVREITALYCTSPLQAARGASPLPPLPIQYADFAVWQRGWLTGEVLERQVAYWREQLATATSTLDLPTDRPRPPVPTYRGARAQAVLGPGVTRGLGELARRREASLYMVLLAGFQAFLGRLTGQEDLTVGSPIANRTHLEIEGLIGFFVNTLLLRGDLSGDPTFDGLLGRVRQTALAAFAHQDLPFERLVAELQPERHLSVAPLFQVMFALQNAPVGRMELPGLALQPLPLAAKTAPFELELNVFEAGETLLAVLSYSTELFDATTARRFAGHLTALLAGAVADPGRRLADLPLLSPGERQQLAAEWNDTSREAAPRGVVERFAAQVACAPETVALEAPLKIGRERLTYGELDRRADRLAARLHAEGVRPGIAVGLFAERTPAMVVGIFAIWKAGGAYLPLDPGLPAARLAYLLEDSEVPLVLAPHHLFAKLPPSRARRVEMEDAGGDAGTFTPQAGDLAYLIYTSGTTGRPKAVLVEHGNLASTLDAVTRAFGFGPADRLPAIASFSFDIFLFELLGPLLAGGTAVLLPLQPTLDLERLAEELATATVLHAVPAVMRQVVELARLRGGIFAPALRALFTGGDVVPAALLEDLRAIFPRARTWVLYGPTEAAIVCTAWPVPAAGDIGDWGAPLRSLLGRPFAGAAIELRDFRVGAGRRVPIGVPGEIWIGGAGVTRGYWRRPEETAERFVAEEGSRWFRSGDLARRLPDGTLEFLGRADQQVKVRGFRIELGEVEAQLLRHPEVRQAVAAVRAGALIAYIVPRPPAERESAAAESAEQVGEWQALYEETYGRSGREVDPTFDLEGWNSSYTGAPIPAEEMREWVERTVERIASLGALPGRPRVVEIGCGTGLLLFRLAPHAESYLGTDFSAAALDGIRRRLLEPGTELPQVALRQAPADDWRDIAGMGGIARGAADLVVLNSVVQYFPGVDYLVRVLSGAVAAVRPGGAVFVGDVRSRPLLPAFAAGVELFQAPSSRDAGEIERRVRRRVADEAELVLDPAFFLALARHLPEIARVDLRLKRGRFHNELTKFRYDVVLHVGEGDGSVGPPPTVDGSGLTLADIEPLLAGPALDIAGLASLDIAGLANARLAAEAALLELLEERGGTAEDLRRAVTQRGERGDAGVDPEALAELAERRGYAVELTVDPADPFRFGAVLRPRGSTRAEPAATVDVPDLPFAAFANDPLAGKLARRLVPELRRFLAAELPDYMVPGAFVLLPELPVTAHGKVDRAALPAPEPAPAGRRGGTSPQTPAEETLAALWREVLGLDTATEIAREDHFFALGGHSLLATQLVSRVRTAFGVDLPLRQVFERPVLADLAHIVDIAGRLPAASASTAPALLGAGSAPGAPNAWIEAPLSFAQERLWFIDRLTGTAAYNIALALTIEGDLSPAALEAALGEIVRRHGSLRTTFVRRGDAAVQRVAPPWGPGDRAAGGAQTRPSGSDSCAPSSPDPQDPTGANWRLPVVDLAGLPLAGRAAEVHRLAAGNASRPFNLARGPLLRAALLRTDAAEFTLLLAMHHIVSDGWSMGIVVREFVPLYRAALAGRPSPLPELQLQYTDFAVWQRQRLAGEALAEQIGYWRENLAGAPAELALPFDRPRPARQSYRGARVPFLVEPARARALYALAARAEATPFMGLLAAFQALLHRFTGEDDILVGSPIANRDRPETEPLIGFFVNTVVLCARFAGGPSYRGLLDRVRQEALGAYAHQELPFERLVAELRPERSLAVNPLFQVMFALERAPVGALDLPGLRLTPLPLDLPFTQFDLTLTLWEGGEGLAGEIEYATDLFYPTTMARLAGHFQNLLAAALETPDRPLAELPLVSAPERAELLAEWNDTRRDDLPDLPLHGLVEQSAAAVPDALAVLTAAGEGLSYGELDYRAGRLAGRLRELGVGPESRVAIAAGRSLDLVVGMLAVLKAGGAYVPIDPDDPAERTADLVADSGARLVLTAERIRSIAERMRERRAPIPPIAVDPAGAAYVIYTSGSTGRAKGVVVSHRSVSLYARSMAERYRLGPGERMLQFAALGFDASVDEIWCPLAAGATLVLRSAGMTRSVARFLAEVERLGATVLSLPTAFWHELALGLGEGAVLPAAVRLAIVGGEEAQPQSLVFWRSGLRRGRPPGREVVLLNAYGPTEATVSVTFADLSSWKEGEPIQPIPIGRPMDGARLQVVDRDLQPVAIGVWGELLIGGVSVARGYLGRPDLTAERFLPDAWPDAWGGEPGGRVYRTGDLVRFRPDGELLWGRRIDQQVKVRGFRVEPGEIEAALAAHPGLRGAAVVARRRGGGDALLACVVPADGEAAPGIPELRAFLAARLPAYMVPSAFAVLPELPQTPSGKVDRRSLARYREESEPDSPPRTPLELRLARLWEEILGVSRVGRSDSFFALGGHSLAATRLVVRLEAALGVEVPLEAVFEDPTLAGMAERLGCLGAAVSIGQLPARAGAPGAGGAAAAVAGEGPLPLAAWRGRGGAVAPLSFAQERLWFVDRLAPGNAAFNMPASLLLHGALDLGALDGAFREVRRRQGSLRTRFLAGSESADGPVQVIDPPGPWSLPRVDLDRLSAARRRREAERLVAADAARPFDLARGPLFRPLLARLGAEEHLLLLTCHHIVSDGWSSEVLVRELATAYTAHGASDANAGFAAGRPAALPELPLQYADFAVWQREQLSGAVLAEQIAHWRKALAGVSPLDLPADRPRRAIPTFRGAARPFRLGQEAHRALAALAREQGATLFMALHAGFAALLALATGRTDLPLGTTIANRTRAELEGLIGFFVNTLVLRADLAGDPDFAELIARSRAVALAAFAHQDLPFERLVDELELPRDPYRPPLLRVLLQLQNAPVGARELPGLTLAPFEVPMDWAKLDLVVNLVEVQEGLAGELRYDADLFDGPTIERLAGHFARLLAAWVADPARPLSALSVLSAGERHQLLFEWNEGEEGAGWERRALHHRFAEQVDRTPDAMAVVAGGERLTYGELDRRANRIAWHLMAAGARPGDRVALCLERSAGMIAAILGVLKAGAAYVPLDPAHPAERLAFVLEDSGASLLLTEGDLLAGLPLLAVPVIRLDEARRESARRPEVSADSMLPAYVIYTSGSTGRPKGVVVSHAHVDRLFTATASSFGFGAFDSGDVWTFFHSYAFDFSVWEIWGALLHGGRLVVVPYWESRSPEGFYRLLRGERVTVLSQTPSAFRQLLWAEETTTGGAPPELALRWVIFGGEALEPSSLAPWFERHGDRTPTLVNMYGITETTVHVTWRPLRTSDLHRGSLLGRPLPDLSLHVLDAALRPQPIGVPGEIHVGGAGLAQGYLGQPERTAERFLPDPFSGEPGARLYRSGDLARRLPDGDLEYLGRIDHQVKIRGFRIELGEIEAVLAAHPQVREAVVLARDGGSGERRLVAYVVPAPGEHLDPADLRAHLAGCLPEPMLPAVFVLLDALPLTVNGKVDRQALPAPEAAGEPAPRRSTPPATPLERFLAGQFRAVLGLPEERAIGSEDDFFALGGSSISGAILIYRLQETLGEIVHVVTIFDHPTVAALAGYVEREHPSAARRLWGVGQDDRGIAAAVGPAEVAALRRLVIEGRPESVPEPAEPPNPPALFVLSPPRSGSTLLRVMLGAHPGLFAPPELELLSFRTMAERHAAFSGGEGRNRFWLEGLVRAVMEARQVGAMEAERIIAEAEQAGWTTQHFYRELSTWLSGRMLVDKTPSYALDLEVLARAEAGFAGARYLHLVRHPQATNRSFVEAKMEQIVFRRPHPFTREQLAELVWTVSHRNILDFLTGVPRERWHTVRFEDLVRSPQRVLAGICDFLGIDYRPQMADPYKPGAARMVDGPHAVSRMLGDVKLLGHGRVDPGVAERWRGSGEAPLGEPARELAAELGYASPGRGVLVRLQEGAPGRRPLFCVHPVGGEVVAYRELARRLEPDEPVYGLQSPEPPIEDLQDMAALYLEALRTAQPAEPYRLAGWSMGGLVAYEMACQLVEQGEEVELLALIDCASPAFWAAQPVPAAVDLVAGFALDLARLVGMEVPEVDLSGLDEEGALALVLDRGRRAGVLALGVELPELRRLFERYRANRRALATCVARPGGCRVGRALLFRASDSAARPDEGPDLGWGDLLQNLRISALPGDHYSILQGHGAAALARALQLALLTNEPG